MATTETKRSPSLNEVLERFIQEENVIMDSLQTRLASISDPDGQSVFQKLAEIRSRYLNDLVSQFGDVKSREEITQQINDMFSI